MISDDSYCSDTCFDTKSNPTITIKKTVAIPPKPPMQNASGQKNRRPIVNRRPIPIRSKNQNCVKPNFPKSSIAKSPIQFDIDSDSSSYYEYDSESEKDEIPIIKANAKPRRPFNFSIKKSNSPIFKPQCKSNQETDKDPNPHQSDHSIPSQSKYHNDDSSSSSYVCEFYEDNDDEEYQDTNEEPQMSEQAINLIRERIFQISSHNENVDTNRPNNASIQKTLKFRITCTKTQLTNYTFHFYADDQCLMIAHTSNTRKCVEFKVPELFEDKDLLLATMNISKNRSQFNLECNGKEVMCVNVSNIKKPFPYNGFFTVYLKYPDTFKKEIVLKSVLHKHRNCDKRKRKHVFLANENDERLITVRKICESKVEIEASQGVNDDLKIFALGVISWIRHH